MNASNLADDDIVVRWASEPWEREAAYAIRRAVFCAVAFGTSRGSAGPSIRVRNVVVISMVGSGPNAEVAGSGFTKGVIWGGICADAAATSVSAANLAPRMVLTNIPISLRRVSI